MTNRYDDLVKKTKRNAYNKINIAIAINLDCTHHIQRVIKTPSAKTALRTIVFMEMYPKYGVNLNIAVNELKPGVAKGRRKHRNRKGLIGVTTQELRKSSNCVYVEISAI